MKKMKRMMIRYFLFSLALSSSLFFAGCCPEVNFTGMSKEQISVMLETAPRRKDGNFYVLHALDNSPNKALVHHSYMNKEALLTSQTAMKVPQWRVFFHLDWDYRWHSYLLTFENGKVAKQEERFQPHWVMAEP